MENFYFTFGSDEQYPFQNGYIIVKAKDMQAAIQMFKAQYPNRPGSDSINCAFYYTEEAWQSDWNQDNRNTPCFAELELMERRF